MRRSSVDIYSLNNSETEPVLLSAATIKKFLKQQIIILMMLDKKIS